MTSFQNMSQFNNLINTNTIRLLVGQNIIGGQGTGQGTALNFFKTGQRLGQKVARTTYMYNLWAVMLEVFLGYLNHWPTMP
jgi:hypothetical protein